MSDEGSHLDEILRLYSEDLVTAVAKLTEVSKSVPIILQELEDGMNSIRGRFLEGLQKGVRDHSDSARKLTESVEATRIQLLGQQAELTKVAAESVGRDLKAAHDALMEQGYIIAGDAARVALLKALTPEVEKIVRTVNELGKKLNEEAARASERMADSVERAQMDVATLNWKRWLLMGAMMLVMSWTGLGLWRVLDNVWPWKLTTEQATSLRVGQTVRDNWTSLDRGSQLAIQKLLGGQ